MIEYLTTEECYCCHSENDIIQVPIYDTKYSLCRSCIKAVTNMIKEKVKI